MQRSHFFSSISKIALNIGFKYLKISAISLLLLSPILADAQGDLFITPRRIVFEGNKQRQEIILANTSQDTAVYSLSFVQYYMREDGSFEIVDEPKEGQTFADKYLRFFPRTVTLAPNESQIVRMQLRRLPGMDEGEYRSHLYFRATPKEQPLGEEEFENDTTAIGVRLTPIFGITIPVIIRVGNTSAKVTLSNLIIEDTNDNKKQLNITFNREGNQSVYGDISVDYYSIGGEVVNIGNVRGIAVYTPNSIRHFAMLLDQPENVDFSAGKLVVSYSSGDDTNPVIFDRQEIDL